MLITSIIGDLIYKINGNSYYEENIFSAYQNNYTLPIHDNFVIITPIGIRVKNTPVYTYDIIKEEQVFYNVSYCGFQIDYYGFPSLQESNNMQLVLSSDYGCEHFQNNGLGVYTVDEIRNLTSILDRDVYVPRHSLEFSLFARQDFKINQGSFGPEIINNINLFYVGELGHGN